MKWLYGRGGEGMHTELLRTNILVNTHSQDREEDGRLTLRWILWSWILIIGCGWKLHKAASSSEFL